MKTHGFFSLGVAAIAAGIIVAAIGCSGGDSAKESLRAYLEERADGRVADNTMTPSDYNLMLQRLGASKEPYIYLFHHVDDDGVIGVYWYGDDAAADAATFFFEDGSAVRFPITAETSSSQNEDAARDGGLQFAVFQPDERLDSKKLTGAEISSRP